MNLYLCIVFQALFICHSGHSFTIHRQIHRTKAVKNNGQREAKLTKVSLFWNTDKKDKKEDASKDSSNTKQTSKMGTTATIMENFKQSQELGKKTGFLIQELSSLQVEGVAAKGKIKVVLDGQQQPASIEIDEEYFNQGSVNNFSEELLFAMQDAYKKSIQLQQDRMQGLYSELGLPSSK